jgi:hsp70-interacting protein
MQSLLRWSLENSTSPDGTVARPQQPLDPGIIDTILGRPDSALMKEALDVATDENRSVDDRVNALEEFETVSAEMI